MYEFHHKVNCTDMAGQKCEHMLKVLSTELLATKCTTFYNKEYKIVYENKCKMCPGLRVPP